MSELYYTGVGSRETPNNVLNSTCEVVNGQPQGGTATAVNLAESMGIPVFNLVHPGELHRLKEFLG